ncbi:MAG TPA: hemolysin family protein, partial [Tepidiformaceae bacterium]|nr:hemolysin family protein [Tepidiformaceae bacterium]
MTYFHVVIGEMVPKALALQRAEQTAIAVTPVMLWIKRFLFPLVLLLNGTGNLVLRLLGVRRETTSEQYYTPEELQFIVRESGESGQLVDESARMLKELFEFGALHARDAMVPRVQVRGIPVGATTTEMRDIMRDEAHTRYPVYERDLDHIVGTLHVKDLLRIIGRRGALTRNDARPVPFLPETSKLDVVLDAMRKSRAQMVIVLDEQGGTAGIVTIEDLFDEVIGGSGSVSIAGAT